MEAISEKLESVFKTADLSADFLQSRISAEIEFAQRLAVLAGKKSWDKLISKAVDVVEKAADAKSLQTLKKAVSQAEEILAPIGQVAKTYSCYCVGHGHMDMNWMWDWSETVAATNDMFITVDKLMDEFPEFCFSQSQTSVYDLIREYNPALFERIKKRVKEGRWEITASEWVEGDKNLASGESLAHHLLYTRRFMKEHFDLDPEDVQIAWNPDTFGHAETIPMIMNAGGVKYYYMCRGGEKKRAPIFWWESPDGSRLLVNLEQTWYNDTMGPHNVRGLLSFCKETGLKDWMHVYGVGDHGGGPTRRDLTMCVEMNNWPIFPNFKFSTTREYFKLIENYGDKFPVETGELNFEFTGCYTSQSDIKKKNRLSELNAQRAQTAAVLDWKVAGKDYPADKIRQAWIKTLFGQFHDILPGSGVKATREYNSGQFQQSAAITGMIQTNALRNVAAKVDTSFAGQHETGFASGLMRLGAGAGSNSAGGGISSASLDGSDSHVFVIFNPVAFKRSDVLTITVWDNQYGDVEQKKFAVCHPDGSEYPAQKLDQGEYWSHRFVKLAIPVAVESLGYTSIVIKPVGRYEKPVRNSSGYPNEDEIQVKGIETVKNIAEKRELFGYSKGDYGMENSKIRVRFDKSSGSIIELTDKQTGKVVISAEKSTELLRYVLERSGLMSSWLIHPAKNELSLQCDSFAPIHFGPYICSYEAKYTINDSHVTVVYSLSAGSDRLDVDLKLNWLEHGSAKTGTPGLRLSLPVVADDALFETPWGTIVRPAKLGQEVPSQRFVNAGNILLVNDSKYGFEFNGDRLQCTLIRSSYEPDPIPEHGKYVMRFGIIPHGNDKSAADCVNAGIAFNNRLQVISSDRHKGLLPSVSQAVVSSNQDNVQIISVKKAEDDQAIVIRLLETAHKDTPVEITINESVLGNVLNAVEIDLLEREIEKESFKKTLNGFSLKLSANSVASVKLVTK